MPMVRAKMAILRHRPETLEANRKPRSRSGRRLYRPRGMASWRSRSARSGMPGQSNAARLVQRLPPGRNPDRRIPIPNLQDTERTARHHVGSIRWAAPIFGEVYGPLRIQFVQCVPEQVRPQYSVSRAIPILARSNAGSGKDHELQPTEDPVETVLVELCRSAAARGATRPAASRSRRRAGASLRRAGGFRAARRQSPWDLWRPFAAATCARGILFPLSAGRCSGRRSRGKRCPGSSSTPRCGAGGGSRRRPSTGTARSRSGRPRDRGRTCLSVRPKSY